MLVVVAAVSDGGVAVAVVLDNGTAAVVGFVDDSLWALRKISNDGSVSVCVSDMLSCCLYCRACTVVAAPIWANVDDDGSAVGLLLLGARRDYLDSEEATYVFRRLLLLIWKLLFPLLM